MKRSTSGSLFVVACAVLCACEALAPLVGLVATEVLNYGKQRLSAELKSNLAPPDATPQAEPDPGVPQLELELRFLKEDRESGEWEVIEDGATLRTDGTQAGSDWFTVEAVPSESCYFYLVNFDATAFPHQIFPRRGESARVEGGVRVPIGKYRLDEYEGKETFYIIVSREPRVDLERIMAAWPDPKDRPETALPGRVEPVEEDFVEFGVAERGVIEGVPGELIRAKEGDLVLTRWFWHRVD